MNQFRKYIGLVLLFALLTLVSQIGGLVLLACVPVFNIINQKIVEKIGRNVLKISTFCLFYALTTFYIVPLLAASFGRVRMPFGDENPNLKPHNFYSVLLNRNYVTPQLRSVTEGVAAKMALKYGDTCVVAYLECNFPFIDGYRLIPHLSHNDGQKIDLSFQYLDAATKQQTAERPSWLGYGVCEEPKAGEENMPELCDERGEWQYNFMRHYIIPQGRKKDFIFNANQTHDLIRFFLADSHVNFVLIEPHLKKRLGFETSPKVRRAPCEAVRHDDHIHVATY